MTTDDQHEQNQHEQDQQHHGQGHDPVNRWATEHYGFEDTDDDRYAANDAPAPRTPAYPAAASASTGQPAPAGASASGRRTGLIVGGVASLALILGLGGVSVAAAADDGGQDGGRGGPDGRRGAVVQVDQPDQGNGGRFDGGRR